MFKKALLVLAFLASATGASYAQTAEQSVPGYYANAPQTGCTVGPCFIPYGSTIPISGSISASLAGFSPTAGATANLSVSNVSSSVNLPAGADVVITNTGATDASFRLTTGAGTAVTTDQVLKAGAATGLHVLTQTVLSAITASSTTTLNVQGGTGLASGYGGGGSGSGGGGTSVAQGSTTAGQSVSPMGCRTLTSAPTDTTAQTNMPWCTTKGSQVMAQPTAADLNATVVGTGTFATQLTGATNNINNISGTVSLPTGAATAALQPTNAAQGSTTSGQTGPLVQCSVTTSAPTYTTAQTDPLNCTTNGAIRVLDNNSAALLTAAQASIPAGSAIIGKVGIDQTTDGTTNAVHLVAGTAIAGKVGIDQTTLGTTNAVQPIAGTTGGLTMFYLTAANSTNATNVKASAGGLYDADLSNNSATPAYVSFYNNSGTPTCGTSIVYQMMIPANSTSGAGWVSHSDLGKAFSSGIAICVTTGIAGTGAVAASAYTISLGYK